MLSPRRKQPKTGHEEDSDAELADGSIDGGAKVTAQPMAMDLTTSNKPSPTTESHGHPLNSLMMPMLNRQSMHQTPNALINMQQQQQMAQYQMFRHLLSQMADKGRVGPPPHEAPPLMPLPLGHPASRLTPGAATSTSTDQQSRTSSSPSQYSCAHCRSTHASEAKLVWHQMCSAACSKQRFTCTQCKAVFDDRWTLHEHAEEVHTGEVEGKRKCRTPPNTCSTTLTVKEDPSRPRSVPPHLNADFRHCHADLLPSPSANICVDIDNEEDWESFMEFDESDEMAKVYSMVADGQSLEVSDPNQCVVCRRVLSCKSALQMHYRTHTGERPFRCRICSRAFTTKGNLKTHMSTHRTKTLSHTPTGHRSVAPPAPTVAAPVATPTTTPHVMPPMPQQQHSILQAALMSGVRPPMPTMHALHCALCHQPMVHMEALKLHIATVHHPVLIQMQQQQQAQLQFQHHMNVMNNNNLVRREEKPPTVLESPMDGVPRVDHHSMSKFEQLQKEVILNSGRTSPTQPVRNGSGQSQASVTCNICLKTCSCQSALEIHYRSHTKERPYKCNLCSRGFSTRGNMKQHVLTHKIRNMTAAAHQAMANCGDEMMYTSDVESAHGSKSRSESVEMPATPMNMSTDLHPRSLLEPPSAPSPPVGPSPLESMRNMWAKTEPAPPRKTPVLSKHQCGVCFKHFSSSSALQIHMRTHTGDKPFRCTTCGRAFTTKGNLKVHMGTHVWHNSPNRRGRRIFDVGSSPASPHSPSSGSPGQSSHHVHQSTSHAPPPSTLPIRAPIPMPPQGGAMFTTGAHFMPQLLATRLAAATHNNPILHSALQQRAAMGQSGGQPLPQLPPAIPAGNIEQWMSMLRSATVCTVCQKTCASPQELGDHLREHLVNNAGKSAATTQHGGEGGGDANGETPPAVVIKNEK